MKACRQLLLSFDAFLVHLFSWSATQIHHWPLAKKTLHCCFFCCKMRGRKKSAKTATTFLVKEQKSVKNESTWETFVWCVDFHAWLEKVWKVTKFRTIYGVFETFYFKAMCSCHSKMYLTKKIQKIKMIFFFWARVVASREGHFTLLTCHQLSRISFAAAQTIHFSSTAPFLT